MPWGKPRFQRTHAVDEGYFLDARTADAVGEDDGCQVIRHTRCWERIAPRYCIYRLGSNTRDAGFAPTRRSGLSMTG